ncbi:Protein of unknown function [Azotobacter beijerinckii]|uniref:DUF2971 domain-containing protein n=1 Tax=Azotobacter beijerinckii TaxID=170623 RepID=A0A1H6QNC2_9GAMM|nr:DUF2971 domain-containing protein [Azotobacter beijerinckii]SEI45261.1 Protein of unknown function [Azotobacter beijerinckii]
MLKPRILFKYRKFDKGCLELLLNKQLWFAEPASLNDHFEGEPSFSEVLNAVWANYSRPESERKIYREKIEQQLAKTGICSFSKARKNQLMWFHYTDEHKGVYIGFREHLLRLEWSHIYPIDVSYQDEYPFKEIIEHFNFFEKHPEVNNFEDIAGDILYSILSTKYSSWRYERERRLVFCRSEAKSFEAKTINSIAFGLRMPEQDKSTLRLILSGQEWSHVKWFQAVKSKTKYALEFKRIQ